MKYIFGPVKSRRLGISLGIDIMPYKTCTMDCVYCECGKTTNLTTAVLLYIKPEDVINELKEVLSKKPKLDNITFSGAGEPTLNPGIKKIIKFIKKNYSEYNVTVLTNGTLLNLKKTRESILGADIIIPSLDAVTAEIFDKIGRPAKNVSSEKVVKGIASLRNEFKGKIYLEIFIIPGINDSAAEINKIKDACFKIHPDGIQLNTLDRPGTEDWVKPAGNEILRRIKDQMLPFIVDIPGARGSKNNKSHIYSDDAVDLVINTIIRRPSTMEDLSITLGIGIPELSDIMSKLLLDEKIEKISTEKNEFYRLKRSP